MTSLSRGEREDLHCSFDFQNTSFGTVMTGEFSVVSFYR